MKAVDLTRSAQQLSRDRLSYRSRFNQQRLDSTSQFPARYEGYADGYHRARLGNGRIVPIQWRSTGALRVGDSLGLTVPGGSLYGFARTMPR